MKTDLISPRLKDARNTIVLFRFATALLDAIIIFSLFAILLLVFRKDVLLAIVPTAIYLTIRSFVVVHNARAVEKVTQKYPSLDERLQTAYDNRRESSLLAERLIADVSKRLDEMHSSSFLERREFSVRIFAAIFLVFAMLTINFLYLSSFDADFSGAFFRRGGPVSGDSSGGGDESMDTGAGKEWESSQYSNKKEKNKVGAEAGGQAPGFNVGPIPGTGGGAGQSDNNDIYGAPSSARVEGRNVRMEVHPEYGGEVEIQDELSAQGERKFQLPDEVEAARTPEQEPVEYEEVIRKYFEKLSSDEGK